MTACDMHSTYTVCCNVSIQAQYSFLYSILSEALTCGDTAVECSNFQNILDQWKQVSVVIIPLCSCGHASMR